MSNRFLLALACVLALGCQDRRNDAGTETALALPGNTESSSPSARDYRSVAEKVVGQSAGVKEGDIVLVFGNDEDLPLLEDLAVEVRKRGASPLITVTTNRFARRAYDEVPAKYDNQVPETNLKLAEFVDVIIGTEGIEARTLKGVPPERVAARTKAGEPVDQLMRKRESGRLFWATGCIPAPNRPSSLAYRETSWPK
jgi:leucyl aminopeptidase (aminopeptidase T)